MSGTWWVRFEGPPWGLLHENERGFASEEEAMTYVTMLRLKGLSPLYIEKDYVRKYLYGRDKEWPVKTNEEPQDGQS